MLDLQASACLPAEDSALSPMRHLSVAANSSHEHNADEEWDRHREEVINLYWDQDLPIFQVQDHMKRVRGFDKSIKVYKGRLRRWGIRKNLKKEEAMQLASGKAVSKFWPDRKGKEYLRRVARHMGQRGEPTTSSWQLAQTARNTSGIPILFYNRDVVEAVEVALFYGDIFLQEMSNRARIVTMSTTRAPIATHNAVNPSKTRDDVFFYLFSQGISDLVQHRQTHLAFVHLNAAFDHLKGLLVADHPIIYYRLASMLLSCREYPASNIARQVCRLLAVHLLQLGRVVMGPGHPIIHWWLTGIKLLDSEQWEYVDKFLQCSQQLGSKYIAYVPGTVDLTTYAPSSMRGLKDAVLRETIKDIANDMLRISEAQEARLCLSEVLLGQGEVQEGLRVLREAFTLRHLDLDRPASKAFWFTELFSRAGEIDEALEILKEATELVKGEDGIGQSAFSMTADQDEVQNSAPDETLLRKRTALEQGIRMFQTHIMYQNTT